MSSQVGTGGTAVINMIGSVMPIFNLFVVNPVIPGLHCYADVSSTGGPGTFTAYVRQRADSGMQLVAETQVDAPVDTTVS